METPDTPQTQAVSDAELGDGNELDIRDRLFREENMFTRMRSFALSEDLTETYQALNYMRERHGGQFRKASKHTDTKVVYINHPLMMACHAHALGLQDDVLLASVLLHDVVEDTGVTLEELPFSDEVKKIVGLVSFKIPDGLTRAQAKRAYYERIAKNEKASLVKLLDRCNNLSTMAGTFGEKKMKEYIIETERYILPLCTVLKNGFPEYSNASFLIKYQMIGLLETVKNLLMDD